MKLTQERLKLLFTYDPESGLFSRLLNSRSPSVGSVNKEGYLVIGVDYKSYRAHRLAWLYVHGYWPKVIDHLDGDRLNNRLNNLRNGTAQDNNQNRAKHRAGHLLGTLWNAKRGRWRAQYWKDGRQKVIGTFETQLDAHNAYLRITKENP